MSDEFDPRFDREFQPGFDPERHRGRKHGDDGADAADGFRGDRTSYAVHPVVPPRPQVDVVRPRGAAAGAAAGTVAEPVPLRPSVEAEAQPERRSSEGGGPDDDNAETAPGRRAVWRNPWLIALTVLGVLLIVGGLQAFRTSVESMYGPMVSTGVNDEPDWVSVQLWWSMGPLFALAGVVTLAGVLYLIAWHWMRADAEHKPRPDA
ncbi:hypothetical protein GCM10027416_04070 [Okibacterium endophyticum]